MRNNIEKGITCSVCLNKFDSQNHLPRILHACGHTVCTFCLKKLLAPHLQAFRNPDRIPDGGFFNRESSQENKVASISCPLCKTTTSVPIITSAINNFNINYALLESIEILENTRKDFQKCGTHSLCSNVFCFDESCPSQKIACFTCLKELHQNCSPGTMINAFSVPGQVEYDDYNMLRENIGAKFNQLRDAALTGIRDAVYEVFEKFKNKVLNEYIIIDLTNTQSIESNLGRLRATPITSGSSSGKVRLSPANKKDMDNLCSAFFDEKAVDSLGIRSLYSKIREELEKALAFEKKSS